MAVFQASTRRRPGTRSNTKLFVSGGMSPAGQWVTDPNLPILFHYDYGGPANKEVVVAKGLLVGIAKERYMDDALGYKKNALTVAGKRLSGEEIRPFGIAPYNFTKHWEHFLDGNQPSVATRDYVELPWFANAADAASVKWGGGHGGLEPGDLVTWSRDPQNQGKFIKWELGTHDPSEIIGQVGEIENDQEPFGWLKWAMWDETARRQDQDGPVNKSDFVPPAADGSGYPVESIRDNTDLLAQYGTGGYMNQYTTEADATGVQGILDGRQRALTPQQKLDTVPAGYAGSPYTVDLGKKNVIQGTVTVRVGGVIIPNSAYAVDYTNGKVTILSATTADNIQVDFRCEFFGTPAGWDFKGVTAVARILLKF